MATIKNVTLIGVGRNPRFCLIIDGSPDANLALQASGALGRPVLNALIKSEKFNVTVIKRPSSAATFPASVTVRTADLSSVDSVKASFEGQDAVVSTVGHEGLSQQHIWVKAAAAANVKRFLPSDFGSNLASPKASVLPVFKPKVETHKVLRETAASNPNFTYTLVCNGPFLDWGLEKNFLLNWKESKPKFFDGGEVLFSTTTIESIAQAVVGVLSHTEETKNRFVYVKDMDVSQTQLLDLAKRTFPQKNWEEPEFVDSADIEKSSYDSMAKGEINMSVMVGFLLRGIFGPAEFGSLFKDTDNELLGLKGKPETEVMAIFKALRQDIKAEL